MRVQVRIQKLHSDNVRVSQRESGGSVQTTMAKGGSFSMSVRPGLLCSFRGSSGVQTLAVRIMFCSRSCFSSDQDREWPARGGKP